MRKAELGYCFFGQPGEPVEDEFAFLIDLTPFKKIMPYQINQTANRKNHGRGANYGQRQQEGRKRSIGYKMVFEPILPEYGMIMNQINAEGERREQ